MRNLTNLKTLRVISIVLLSVLSTNLQAAGTYSGGNGDPNDPYLIESADDIIEMSNDPNNWDMHFLMIADVNMIDYTFTTAVIAPDTNDSSSYIFDGVPFTGKFNGNGHRTLNLTIDTKGFDKDYLGLFGLISAGAVVANLGIEDVSVIGSGNWVNGDFTGDFGALVGNNSGVIQNCWVNGSVTGGNFSEDIGGLCGWNQSTGTIASCYVIGSVGGGANSGGIGGLCGSNDGSIINCWASSSVTGKNSLGGLCGFLDGGSISNCNASGSVTGGHYSENLGGLCGHNTDGSISNCYATGSVTGGDHSDYLGGLCGENENGTITDCYATDSVIGGDDSWSLGGLCGGNTGTASNCYSTGSVAGGDDSWFLGGLCGVNVVYGAIDNCYSTGSVNGGSNSRYLGGLCGGNGEIGPGLNSEGGIISNCYSTGSVNGDNDLGGLCGHQYGDSAEISNCFWDTETSEMTVGYNLDSSRPGTITNVVGKTTAEMKQKSTFTNWDFIEDWGIEDNQTYPFLKLTYPVGDLNLSKDVNLADLSIMAYHWLQSTGP